LTKIKSVIKRILHLIDKCLPVLRLLLLGIKQPAMYALIRKNKKFKNLHKGQRCFILGNGPSLKDQDLSLLQNEIVFTVNQIATMDGFDKIKTNYHFWADPAFFEKKYGDTSNFMYSVNTEDNKPECFAPHYAYDWVKINRLDLFLKINFFMPLWNISRLKKKNEFTKPIAGAYTVVHYAVLLAIFMGFSEIYLLGCDMTGILTNMAIWQKECTIPGYAYELREADKVIIKEAAAVIAKEDVFYGYGNMFAGYRLLNEYCTKNNIKFSNLTRGGILDILLRENYEDVIGTKNNGIITEK